jgi:hypothetical protein
MDLATLTKKDLKEYNKWKSAMDKRVALPTRPRPIGDQ